MYLQKVIKISLFILLLGINITFILINQISSEKERDRNMTARSITYDLTTPIDIICNTSDSPEKNNRRMFKTCVQETIL